MTEKVQLTGGPEKTVTWIWLEDGRLQVEYYDFSESAQAAFGNDIAYLLTIDEIKKLFSLTRQDESSLVEWIRENFRSYFEIKQWLEQNEIGFRRDIDSWA